jgi:hypothetical protein
MGTRCHGERVDIGQDDVPARTNDAGDLGDRRPEVPHMGQREPAYGHVEAPVRERQPMKVRTHEGLGRPIGSGAPQHRERAVQGDHLVAEVS